MNKKDLRIVFMGTPDIAAKVFLDMINDGYQFVGLICQIDKPIGRKKVLQFVPTKVVALEHNIPVFQPIKIRLDYEFVKNIHPDLIITMAYGQIVPQGLLDIPRFGCLNLHASLLPKYRGAAPIQRAIMNGETETGVSLMEMIDKMDAGRVYDTIKVNIDEQDNFTSLKNKIASAASQLVIHSLPLYLDNKLTGVVQNENLVTFANKILPENEHLSFDDSCKNVINTIRGLSEEPGGYAFINDKKLKIYKATKYDISTIGKIGEIVDDNKQMIVQCIDGTISLKEVQLEGKNKSDIKSFINGHPNLRSLMLK